MMLTLIDLAPELVLSIVHQLELERDVNALNQTCRHLYSMLDRELYRRDVQQHGSSALLWAARHGQVATIRKLIAEGADICSPREGATSKQSHFSPLMLSIFYNHEAVTRILIEHGADIGEHYPSLYHECTTLHMAAAKASTGTMQLLLSKGMDVGAQDTWLQTPLHWAMMMPRKRQGDRHENWARTVVVLLRARAKMGTADVRGRTPRDLATPKQNQMMDDMDAGRYKARTALKEITVFNNNSKVAEPGAKKAVVDFW